MALTASMSRMDSQLGGFSRSRAITCATVLLLAVGVAPAAALDLGPTGPISDTSKTLDGTLDSGTGAVNDTLQKTTTTAHDTTGSLTDTTKTITDSGATSGASGSGTVTNTVDRTTTTLRSTAGTLTSGTGATVTSLGGSGSGSIDLGSGGSSSGGDLLGGGSSGGGVQGGSGYVPPDAGHHTSTLARLLLGGAVAGATSAEAFRALKASVERLEPCMGSLPPAEQQVLALRFGLGGGRPQSLRGIARRLGMPVSGVRRAERNGIRSLRNAAGNGCAAGYLPPAARGTVLDPASIGSVGILARSGSSGGGAPAWAGSTGIAAPPNLVHVPAAPGDALRTLLSVLVVGAGLGALLLILLGGLRRPAPVTPRPPQPVAKPAPARRPLPARPLARRAAHRARPAVSRRSSRTPAKPD
jgi:hypothetical protein